MSASRQTAETIRADFDRIARLGGAGWDHNAHYHAALLRHLPRGCARALEIGCGRGEFSRLLARRAASVVAVDLSPQMIRVARERTHASANVEFVCGDVMEMSLPDESFDCVATLTTMHHLPARDALRKVARALRPGGVFLCLDLYRRGGLFDLVCDAVAYPVSPLVRLWKTGRPRGPRELREAYDEHGATDTYMTLRAARRVYSDEMPGAHVRRHLFWRYSVVWKKAAAGS